jgi:Flp pilus assembly protein TadD
LGAAIFWGSVVFAQTAPGPVEDPAWITTQRAPHESRYPKASVSDASVSSEHSFNWNPPAAPGAASGASQTVSLYELSHKVPGKAMKEYRKAHELAAKGEVEQAVERFQKALEIDPGFVDAQNDLGALYLKSLQPKKAVPLFESALSRDPKCKSAYTNLALAYIMQDKFHDAETTARRLKELDGSSNRTRFILALALVTQDKFTDEAASLLRRASEDIPHATLLLGRTLAARGDIAGATEKVKAYLKHSDSDGRALATRWLKTLQQTNGLAADLR